MKVDTLYPAVFDSTISGDGAGRGVDFKGGDRFRDRDHAGFNGHGCNTDDAVSAHGAVAFIVEKKYPEVRVLRYRRRDDAAVHVGMAPGFPHQRGSQVIQIFLLLAFGYLIRKTGDYHLSSDIMQESFARMLRSYGSGAQNSSLLYTIARNALLDHSKKSSRQAPLAEQPQDISADPEKQFMIRESYHRMLAALEQLDEGERDILSLAANGDLSYREIGKIIGISEANVKIRVHRARIKLRKIFKEEIPNGISK